MDTLSAAYQFTADAFRHFIIRTLTDDIPPDGDEKEIARFIRKRRLSTVWQILKFLRE
ncbi:hypothetical protein ACRWXB_20255 [Escherichia coli]